MIAPRFGLLLVIFNSVFVNGVTSHDAPKLKWHRDAFFSGLDNLLTFPMGKRLDVSCEPGYYGTVREVSKECYDSCLLRDCNPSVNGMRGELFTCNEQRAGAMVLRRFNPNPSAISFKRENEEYYFTSLIDRKDSNGVTNTMCDEGMKFRIVVVDTKNTSDVTHSHPLLMHSSNHDTYIPSQVPHHTTTSKSHGSHISHTSKSHHKLTPSTVNSHHKTTSSPSIPTEYSQFSPMVEGKDLREKKNNPFDRSIFDDLERLDRLTNTPFSPFVLHGSPIDPTKISLHKFDRMATTVEYGEDGEVKYGFEVALPLGYDLNSSSSLLSFIPITTVILLLAILL
ncbi:hypothetical protein PFISCL1PPCAC_15236 [Pristionchus fissidentatus]|uniref:Uncharacterized protein n=1 Tax=Pristionchus fissidentatus TaxID=1538716 RepID=A0AAV5VZU5_9BILA|nr:hypothetical protein PFISCL1PPCAC_15236 [Pristionchus fissidentatus]